ncbi:putative general transcription factor IIE subunit 1-like [Cocos nucifera]|nr:putative general transcription factor IIE subunit 1-like [Cocos nucifera]
MYSSVTPPTIGLLGTPTLSRLSSSFITSSFRGKHTPEIITSLIKPLLSTSTADQQQEVEEERKSSHSLPPPIQTRRPSAKKIIRDDHKPHKVSHELSVPRQCSYGQAVLNGINVLCGVGILSTPYAVKEGGWIGLSILLIFAVLSWYTGILLRNCLDSEPGLETYPDIGQAAFGTTGRLAVSIILYLELYGCCVEYIILESDNLSLLFPKAHLDIGGLHLNSHLLFAIMATAVVLPTTWLRDLSLLSYISGLVMSLIGSMLTMLVTLILPCACFLSILRAKVAWTQTAKCAKVFSAAFVATGDGQQIVKEGEEKTKLHTHSYCCLDYAQIYDVVRYRLHRMKKKLKDELDSRNTIQEYTCPNCGRRYSAFDALQLVSLSDDYFHCENCNGELVAESDKLAAEEMGDGDDNARRRRREKLKDMLQKMEEQLKPLTLQLARVKDLPAPEFGSLQAWEARANAAARASADSSTVDSTKSSQGQGYGGTPMPFLGETRVEIALSGVEVKEEDTESDTKTTAVKVLPPWMIKQGMNLTKEQRGEDEYLKAYYEALVKRQKEQEEALKKMQQESETSRASKSDFSNGDSEAHAERRVGMKSKREDDENDDVEWEEAPPAGNTGGTYKLADLNVEANGSSDDEDDIDWEEG